MKETEILRDGYRRLGTAFDAWRDRIADDPRAEWRDLLASKLDPDARLAAHGADGRARHARARHDHDRTQRCAAQPRTSASRKAERSGAGRAATTWILARR